MDQLLLRATDHKKGNEEDDKTSQTDALTDRLYLFWNGAWDMLLTDSSPPDTPHGLPPDDTKLAARVEKLTQEGETGRATATLTAPPKIHHQPLGPPTHQSPIQMAPAIQTLRGP